MHKESLRPSKGKLIIGFIIFLLILFWSIQGTYTPLCPEDMAGSPDCYMNSGLSALLIDLGLGFSLTGTAGFVVDIIISAIVGYLLACLIVWVYNKIKR